MSGTHLSLRVPEELNSLLDEAAESVDVSKSELCRNLLWDAVGTDGDVFDELPTHMKRKVWQREAKPEQHRAWFRSNVKQRMFKCWNSGLTTEEMKLDMTGRRKEAREYGKLDWLDGAIETYDAAREEEDFQMLRAYFDTRMDPEDAEPDESNATGPEIVLKAESWRCESCGTSQTSGSDNYPDGTVVLGVAPDECGSCGHDRFVAEGETEEIEVDL